MKGWHWLFFCLAFLACDKLPEDETKPQEGYKTGLVIPEDAGLGELHVTWDSALKEGLSLPKEFIGPKSGVRNQGNCGSCFVFASTAAVEGAAMSKGLPEVDLSDQAVLDCSQENSHGCDGGWDQFKFLKERGAPLEKDYPYTARQGQCRQFTSVAPPVDNYGFVGGTNRKPTEQEVVQAIYEFKGATWISIAADNDFMNAQVGPDGVFRSCQTNEQTNHVVHGYGYKEDPQNPGHYLIGIKNSWSTQWNRGGIMWLPFGCKKLGEMTMFVTVKGQTPPEPTPSPEPTPGPGPGPGPGPEPVPCEFPHMALAKIAQYKIGEKVRIAVIPEAGFSYEWFKGRTSIAKGENLDLTIERGISEYVVKAKAQCGAIGEVRTRVIGVRSVH